MDVGEKIYAVVKGLPQAAAAEVLDYAERKRAETAANASLADRRTVALALLDKHAGKFKAIKCNRADLYDRASVR